MMSETGKRNLQATRRMQKYRRVLWLCWQLLTSFAVAHHFTTPQMLSSDASEANSLLIAFTQHLYDDDKPLYLAVHAILAIQYIHRGLKGRLRPAWDSIESWQFEVETTNRAPMPLLVLYAFTTACRIQGLYQALHGNKVHAYQLIVMSVLSEMAFFGLLRPGEMLALRKGIIFLPNLFSGTRWPSVAIERPKAWRAMGRRQFATVRAPLGDWLAWLLVGFSAREKLWIWDAVVFRKLMHSTLIAMGLGQFGFTTSSFRAGGATHYATTGVDIHRLKFWGRWASEKSLTSYIQEACAHTIMSQIGSKLTQRLEAFVSANSFVRAPPHKPWQYYLLRA
jgi:hypothetical protein